MSYLTAWWSGEGLSGREGKMGELKNGTRDDSIQCTRGGPGGRAVIDQIFIPLTTYITDTQVTSNLCGSRSPGPVTHEHLSNSDPRASPFPCPYAIQCSSQLVIVSGTAWSACGGY